MAGSRDARGIGATTAPSVRVTPAGRGWTRNPNPGRRPVTVTFAGRTFSSIAARDRAIAAELRRIRSAA